MKSIYWHDYETTGTDTARDRPLQFAGIRTDEDLNIIGEPLTLYCKPSRDTLPHPMAALVTGITPQLAAEKGVPEPEFIARVHREFMVPETCVAGYNSIRFDDEVTRYTLYRNFFDPYEREWKNGNSRWDIIDMLRLTRALRPEGIEWPDREDGSPSFRLEELTAANGLSHEAAHDALSDVMATIAMARLVRERQPRLYDYVYGHRQKQKVAALLDVAGRKPFLHVSSRLPRETGYTALMMPLCQHPTNKNAVIAFNLSADPADLLKLDADAIRERLFTPAAELSPGQERIPLKAVHLNRCPVVATPRLLDSKAAGRLGIDLEACERHWQQLREADLGDRMNSVFATGGDTRASDAELALYQGFLPDSDRALLAQVREASGDELAQGFAFSDARYRTLLFRYRARYYPQTLTPDEQQDWEAWRFQQLTDPAQGGLTLDDYFEQLEALETTRTSERDRAVIAALRDWGDELLA